jgi:hypothetical protein
MMPQPPVPKWPSDRARIQNNRLLVAGRTGWPEGALRACADLEDRHPGWHVWWMPENVAAGWERPAGFCAEYEGSYHRAEIFRSSGEELAERMAEGVPEHEYDIHGLKICAWCLQHPGQRPVRL